MNLKSELHEFFWTNWLGIWRNFSMKHGANWVLHMLYFFHNFLIFIEWDMIKILLRSQAVCSLVSVLESVINCNFWTNRFGIWKNLKHESCPESCFACRSVRSLNSEQFLILYEFICKLVSGGQPTTYRAILISNLVILGAK